MVNSTALHKSSSPESAAAPEFTADRPRILALVAVAMGGAAVALQLLLVLGLLTGAELADGTRAFALALSGASIILGHVALRRAKLGAGGERLARTGMVLGYISAGISVLVEVVTAVLLLIGVVYFVGLLGFFYELYSSLGG